MSDVGKIAWPVLVLAVIFPADVSGQNIPADTVCSIVNLQQCSSGSDSLIQRSILESIDVGPLLEDPQTLNQALGLLAALPGLPNLFTGLSVQFKTFYSADSSVTALGFSYEFTKDFIRSTFEEHGPNYSDFSFAFSADGNVSVNADVNPRNFLDTKLSFTLSRSRGGVGRVSTPTEAGQFAERIDELATLDTEAELRQAEQGILADIRNRLSNQLYLDLGLAGSLESDQSFDQTQLVAALDLGVDLKAWNSNSTLARLNIFDWPFAVVRYLTGVDPKLSPRGSNIPTAVVGLGVVDPSKNPVREALGEMEPYWRFNFETAFRSLVVETPQTSVFFQANFRYYQEISAPGTIRAADLDQALYFVAALAATNGLFASYSAGRLPFDAQDDQVYALGFNTNF